MKKYASIGLGLLVVLLLIGFVGCGFDKYDLYFGMGTTAKDGVSTQTSVDQLKDGVLPAEPETPEKKKQKPEEEIKPIGEEGEKPKSP